MSKVIVKDTHLTYNGITYFRGGAEQLELGSIGVKLSSLGKTNYLEVRDKIDAGKFKSTFSNVAEIDTTRLTKYEFEAKVAAIVPVSGMPAPITVTGDAAFEQIKLKQLELVKFTVFNYDMMNAVNSSPQMLTSLAEWGPKARIAHQIFVVMDARLAQKFDNRTTIITPMGPQGIDVTVGGAVGSAEATSVRIAAGSCFAYLLARIEWNSKKTEIVDLNDDQWGLS